MKLSLERAYLVFTLVLCCFCFSSEAANIVSNPSFEELKNRSTPVEWSPYLPPPPERNPLQLTQASAALLNVDSSTAHQGVRSLRISSLDLVRCSIAQRLPLKAGQKVILTVWIKGEDLTVGKEQGAWVRLGFTNKTNPEIDRELTRKNIFLKSSESSFDWCRFSTEVTIPEGAEVVTLECYLWQSKGTAWFDEVSVQVVSE